MLDIAFILDRPAPEHHAKRRSVLVRRLHALAAALFVVAAGNHLFYAWRGEGVVWRHALFVGVNVVAAALLVLRPRAALVLLALLACQQIPSHGGDLVRSIAASPAEPVDWPSLGVVLFFPAVLTLLVVGERERRRGTRARPSGGPPSS